MISFLGTNIYADYSKLAYDYKFNDLDGSELNLNKFKDKVIVSHLCSIIYLELFIIIYTLFKSLILLFVWMYRTVPLINVHVLCQSKTDIFSKYSFYYHISSLFFIKSSNYFFYSLSICDVFFKPNKKKQRVAEKNIIV